MQKFTIDTCKRFSRILLKTQSDDNMSIAYGKETIDVIGDEGRLLIKLSIDGILIGYMAFKNKRKGTGTAIINECIDICKEEGLGKVTVIGVISKDMECLCKKLGFSKVEYHYYDDNDYELLV